VPTESLAASPRQEGGCKPYSNGHGEDGPRIPMREEFPDNTREAQESHSTERGTFRIKRSCLPSPDCMDYSSSPLFFSLMSFHQGCARRKDCRKSKKQAPERRSEFPGQQSRDNRDGSAEQKSDSYFSPFRFRERREIKVNLHHWLPQYERPDPECTCEPQNEDKSRGRQSVEFVLHHQVSASRCIQTK
jgi:hypothetical protein